MDKTKIDFNYCLEQIKREINTEYKPQDIYLDSNDMNEVFSIIENSLYLYSSCLTDSDTVKIALCSFPFNFTLTPCG